MDDAIKTENRLPAEKDEQQKRIAGAIASRINELVLQVPGVIVTSGATQAGFGKKAKADRSGKGVRVLLKNNTAQVNVHIVVAFGKSIPDIARRIQRETKELFDQVYPGFHLSAANILVDGVRFDTDSLAYRQQAVESLAEFAHTPSGFSEGAQPGGDGHGSP